MMAARKKVTRHPHGRADRPPLWSRDLVLAWFVNFCCSFVFYALTTTMTVYAVSRFAASESAGGLAASVFVVGATAARIVAGPVVDFGGRRRVLVLMLVLAVMASLGYFLDGGFAVLLLVRALHGACVAIASTAAMSIAQSAIPATRRAEGTGYFSLSTTLATALGPSVSLVVVERFGHTELFTGVIGISAAAVVTALFIRGRDTRPAGRPTVSLASLVHPAVIPIASLMVVAGCCYASVITYLNPYAGQRGLEPGAGLFFIAYAAAMLGSRFVLGPRQDRQGDNSVAYLCIGALAISLSLLAAAGANWMVVVSGAFAGLGFGGLMSAAQTIAVSRVTPERFGVAISSFFLLTDVGDGLGPAALGLLAAAVGYSAMFGFLAGVMVLAAGHYFLVHGRYPAARHGRAHLAGPAQAEAEA